MCLWAMLHAPTMWAVLHAQQCVQAVLAGRRLCPISSQPSPQGTVWAVLTCWQDVHVVALWEGQDVRASSNEGLLVGQADVLSSLDGGTGGLQSSTANDAYRGTQEEIEEEENRHLESQAVLQGNPAHFY